MDRARRLDAGAMLEDCHLRRGGAPARSACPKGLCTLTMFRMTVLEDRLLDYSGTILMVSHDREFLNNVVTSTIVFEGEGRLQEFVGGYADWVRQSTAEAMSRKTKARDRTSDAHGKPGRVGTQ